MRGIGATDVRVGIRTGDTPQRERAAMLRNPPDILITTPESLYLMLTSRARETLSGVEAVIVDEIHAVAATKRGSHLALTLERLEAQARAGVLPARPADRALARPRIRSRRSAATSSGRTARSRSSTRARARSSTCGSRCPVESMAEPDVRPPMVPAALADALVPGDPLVPDDSHVSGDPLVPGDPIPPDEPSVPGEPPVPAPSRDPLEPLEPVAGGESTRGSIWPAIYPELLRLVREHNSTIMFVNNRRSAERVALRLNELAAREDAAADAGARGEKDGLDAGSWNAASNGAGAQ